MASFQQFLAFGFCYGFPQLVSYKSAVILLRMCKALYYFNFFKVVVISSIVSRKVYGISNNNNFSTICE